LALPTRIGDYNGIGRVVDDNRVVDVVVDDIVGRRRNVVWRVDIDRHRRISRNRKHVGINRRRWRSQIDEVDRPRRQEKYRWRRRRFKSKIRVVENQHRPLDINDLFRRRRRNIVGDDFESRRRFESSPQICQPTPRVVGMEAAGVTTQIRPVGGWRVDVAAAPPRDGLAAGRNNGSHASRHRITGIGDEEVFIVLQIVAIERCEIGFAGVKITDRLRSDR